MIVKRLYIRPELVEQLAIVVCLVVVTARLATWESEPQNNTTYRHSCLLRKSEPTHKTDQRGLEAPRFQTNVRHLNISNTAHTDQTTTHRHLFPTKIFLFSGLCLFWKQTGYSTWQTSLRLVTVTKTRACFSWVFWSFEHLLAIAEELVEVWVPKRDICFFIQ